MIGMSTGFNKDSFKIPAACVSSPSFALDIGGSLAKLAYVNTVDEVALSINPDLPRQPRTCHVVVIGRHHLLPATELDGYVFLEIYNDKAGRGGPSDTLTVHLVTFLVDDIDSCLSYVKDQMYRDGELLMTGQATGVGCLKFRRKIHDILGVDLISDCKEMVHATCGLGILWKYLSQGQLVGEGSDAGDLVFQTDIKDSGLLPCLLVNVGSAMTVIKVNHNGKMKNIVGGSTLAGLSLLGLGALLTSAQSFPELLELASRGNNANVDLLVRDTAGEEYNNVPQEGMVSSFGRAARTGVSQKSMDFAQEDLANSLVKAITSNLAATAFYVARAEKVKYVCFCGSFIGGNALMTDIIIQQIKSASMILQHEVKSVFLRLEAYLGAVGVLLGSSEVDKDANGDLG